MENGEKGEVIKKDWEGRGAKGKGKERGEE